MPEFMQRRLEKKPVDERLYYGKMLDLFGVGSTRMSFVKQESIRNQFYSDLVTPVDDGITRISKVRTYAVMRCSMKNCWSAIPGSGLRKSGTAVD